jgi:hypothetical protein
LDECPDFIQFNPTRYNVPKIIFVQDLCMFPDEMIIPGYRIPVMAGYTSNSPNRGFFQIVFTD